MIQEICFFNHFHNGDVFNSKVFVQDIIKKIDNRKYYYAHSTNQKILLDTNVIQLPMAFFPINNTNTILHNNDIMFVNTWIGAYFHNDLMNNIPAFGTKVDFENECSLRFSYKMYKRIYKEISEVLKLETPIELDDIQEYWPTVNYSKFNMVFVNRLLMKHSGNKRILISNGPGHSGQCSYNQNMADMILEIAATKSNYTFIVTHKFPSTLENILFTDDMQVENGDLNEISFLSCLCDIIIGRSSGPFTFSITKDNVDDPNKTFFCFGDRETDYFIHGTPTVCKSIFHKFESTDKLKNEILSIL